MDQEENKVSEPIEESVEKQETNGVDISSLIIESGQANVALEEEVKPKKEHKIFKKYKIKDIVFLAIMSACMLLSGVIMPIVGGIPVFGIVQMCLGLQFALFPTIGMLKVGKPGALLFMALFCGVILSFMAPIMLICMAVCALIAELLTILIFRNMSSYKACFFAGTIWFPISLPFLYIYYNILYTVDSAEGSVQLFLGANVWVAIGTTVAVLVICAVGALIGAIITKELRKAGVIKK